MEERAIEKERKAMMFRKRKDGKKQKRRIIALGVIFALVLPIIVLDLGLKKPIRALAAESARANAAQALNHAVTNVLSMYSASGKSPSFTSVRLSDNGASVLEIDAAGLNMIAAQITAEAQRLMSELGESGISIPIGTITGISALTGAGPSINIEIAPIGSVNARYSSTLSEAGINQTKYTAYLNLEASVRLILSGSQETVTVSFGATVAEAIIVGDVPQVYTNVSSLDDALNLIPTEVP